MRWPIARLGNPNNEGELIHPPEIVPKTPAALKEMSLETLKAELASIEYAIPEFLDRIEKTELYVAQNAENIQRVQLELQMTPPVESYMGSVKQCKKLWFITHCEDYPTPMTRANPVYSSLKGQLDSLYAERHNMQNSYGMWQDKLGDAQRYFDVVKAELTDRGAIIAPIAGGAIFSIFERLPIPEAIKPYVKIIVPVALGAGVLIYLVTRKRRKK